MKGKRKIKIWELSLLIALCFTLVQAASELGRQNVLSEKIVRLHVIADSDEGEAQELKMRVQGAVAEELAPLLADAGSAEEAGEIIEENWEKLLSAAGLAAGGEPVEIIWGRESYGFRRTESYALPAGEYNSLRVLIGEGEGRNWWGVIFPQLDATSGYAQAAKYLSEDELALICESDDYVLRFRFLELLEKLRLWLEG